MLTLNYNDLGAIKMALQAQAEHHSSLAAICPGIADFQKREAEHSMRLAKAFDALGDQVLRLDLDKSKTIRVKF